MSDSNLASLRRNAVSDGLALNPPSFYSWGRALELETHHVRYAVNGCAVPDGVHCKFSLRPAIPESFERHVDTDFVAVFEAVGHSFGSFKNRHIDAIMD